MNHWRIVNQYTDSPSSQTSRINIGNTNWILCCNFLKYILQNKILVNMEIEEVWRWVGDPRGFRERCGLCANMIKVYYMHVRNSQRMSKNIKNKYQHLKLLICSSLVTPQAQSQANISYLFAAVLCLVLYLHKRCNFLYLLLPSKLWFCDLMPLLHTVIIINWVFWLTLNVSLT